MNTTELLTAFSLQNLLDTYKKIDVGITISDLKTAYYSALANKETIIIEIDKKYTLADLKKRVMHSSGDKKASLVKEFFEGLMIGFKVTDGLLSYSPYEGSMFGGTYNPNAYFDALTIEIEKQTQEDIDKAIEAETAKKELALKCLTNPETLQEFNYFLRVKPKSELTPVQLAKYEELTAGKQLETKKEEQEKKAVVSAVSINAEMKIIPATHTLKGHNIWVVKLSERVEREVYNDLNNKAKKLGGYYSSYAKNGAIPGFTFTEEEAAQKFVALKEGDQKTEKYENRQEEKEEKTVNKFFVMADDLEAKGSAKLTQERKTNTNKRVREAASAEADAENMIYWAKVLRAIAEKMDKEEIKYLNKISSFSQVQELKDILREGFNKRSKEGNFNSDKRHEERNNHLENLNFVSFPLPEVHKETLQRVCENLINKPGQKLRAAKFLKAIKACKHEYIFRVSKYGIDDLKALISGYNGHEGDFIKKEIASYDRVVRMGLDSIELLKMALREFIPCLEVNALNSDQQKEKKVKELERAFVGKKIDGFFPTPENVIEEMIAFANIREGDIVLEPSAGLGHIADEIREQHPNNILNCVEVNSSLTEALKAKGHHVIHMDFLQFNTQYDKIIMNPPFEDNQDIAHVLHAYSLLNPGGRLVAIMGAGAFFRSGKTETNFRNWLNEVGGTNEELPEGSFKSSFRPTGVNTQIVIIDKE